MTHQYGSLQPVEPETGHMLNINCIELHMCTHICVQTNQSSVLPKQKETDCQYLPIFECATVVSVSSRVSEENRVPCLLCETC